MNDDCFVTVTGLNHYYGEVPFEIGRVFRLVKEPHNEYDPEAICAQLPYIGTIGYVANSVSTVAGGTRSAGRLYDCIGDSAFAQVLFVLRSSVIAYVLPAEEAENAEILNEAVPNFPPPTPDENPGDGCGGKRKPHKFRIGFVG